MTWNRRLSVSQAKARWLQSLCLRLHGVLGMEMHVGGPVPQSGLLVSNHLGYLDVLVLGALTPAIFVAKAEVRNWPVFGWFARMAGTIFVRRENRRDILPAQKAIRDALEHGHLVVLFPEATSSDGTTVLPFKPSFLASVEGQSYLVSAGLLHYSLPGANVAKEVCYWGDMTLVPHLFNLLGKRGLAAHVSLKLFRTQAGAIRDRKDLAQALWREVQALGNAGRGSVSEVN